MKVKMLAVLALVLLVSCASEGRIASKCELKSQLEAALGVNQGGPVTSAPVTSAPVNVTVAANVTGIESVSVSKNVTVAGTTTVPVNTTLNTLVAQIVCSVERLSRFNTRLVNTIKENPRPAVRPPGRPQQSNERPGGRPGRPGGRPGRPGGRGKRSNSAAFRRPSQDSSSSESSEEVTTRLLGIFQLSDRVACDSGSGQSLNICKINCRALVDDDIRDDIACLRTLLNAGRNAPFLPVKECRNVNPARYFAECR